MSDYLAASVRVTAIKHYPRPPGRNTWLSESQSVGCGTIVYSGSEQTVIVGCSHQFDSPYDEIMVEGVKCPRSVARLIARDEASDLAVLQIDRGDLPAIPPATWTPPIGQRVYAVGCARGAMPIGVITQTAEFVKWLDRHQVEILAARQSGDSGGGWFARGSLLAVCSGNTDGHGLGTGAPQILAMLRRAGCVRPSYSAALTGTIESIDPWRRAP